MQALIFRDVNEPLEYTTINDPHPAEGEVLVKLHAAALNRRDVWITQGLYPGIVPDRILGSDGAGEYDGRAVIINPNIGWGSDPRFADKKYTILGMPHHGTFAEYLTVPADRLVDMPGHLSWEEAAALPLGGMTAYRALFTKGQVQPGERVLVTGAGGGVALFVIQFALAAGAEVYVTSGSEQKLERAARLGVAGGVNYHHEHWEQNLAELAGGEFDLIIDSAAGEGFNRLIKVAARGGRIVFYGGSQGAVPKFKLQPLFWKQLTLMGTTMSTDEEFRQMVMFVDHHRIHPVLDSVMPLSQGQSAFDRMAQSMQFGKIVLTMEEEEGA